MSRLTVRFGPSYDHWIADVASDRADAVRALMVLGAAALGLPGAAREAERLLAHDFRADIEDALLHLTDRRQTSGRQAADVLELFSLPQEQSDPFAVGIEV